MKKLLSILLVFSMVFSMMSSMTVFASDDAETPSEPIETVAEDEPVEDEAPLRTRPR